MSQPLTERQRQCLQLSATMTDKDIGRHLGISHHTASLHIREALRKLGAPSRKAALRRLAADPLYGSGAIPPHPDLASADVASGDQTGETRLETLDPPNAWPLPPPPGSRARLGLILLFAAIAALVTVGIVSVVSGAVGAIAPHAPANAILTSE